MFISELLPIFKELTQQPIAFMGGFVSGVLRLNLAEEPLKSWLEKQGIDSQSTNSKKDKSNLPQTIAIE
jgi:hypothetical protein